MYHRNALWLRFGADVLLGELLVRRVQGHASGTKSGLYPRPRPFFIPWAAYLKSGIKNNDRKKKKKKKKKKQFGCIRMMDASFFILHLGHELYIVVFQ